MTVPLAENFDAIYFLIVKPVIGIALLFATLLALIGSIDIPYAPPKSWSFWITIIVLAGGSAWCFLTMFR